MGGPRRLAWNLRVRRAGEGPEHVASSFDRGRRDGLVDEVAVLELHDRLARACVPLLHTPERVGHLAVREMERDVIAVGEDDPASLDPLNRDDACNVGLLVGEELGGRREDASRL